MSELNEHIERLNSQRLHAWEEGKKLLEQVNARSDASFSEEEKAKWDKINADVDGLDAQLRSAKDRAERDAEMAEIAEARAAVDHIVRPTVQDERTAEKSVDEQAREFFHGRAPGNRDNGRTLELNLAAVANERAAVRSGAHGQELRDLLKVTAAAGGNTVPTDFLHQLYDYLEVYSGLRKTNVSVLTTDSGTNLEYPTVAVHGTAAIVGEGSALAEADATFGKVTLYAWKYGVLTQLSNELITDSGVDVLGFVAKDAGRAIGRVTDTAYVTGSGTNAPQGIVGIYATAITGQTGATGLPSYTNLVDMIYSINEEYRARGAGWLWKDATVGKIRTIVDGQSRPLWEPDMTAGSPGRLMGFPVWTDPNMNTMATGVAVGAFGDFSCHMIRDVSGVRFERSDEFAFSSDLVTFRTVLRTDSRQIDSTGIRIYKGGTA